VSARLFVVRKTNMISIKGKTKVFFLGPKRKINLFKTMSRYIFGLIILVIPMLLPC